MSFENFVRWMYAPTNPASLGIIRILFGSLMMIDTVFERGGTNLYEKWGKSCDCHFPLFSFWKPAPFPLMITIYSILFICALGITLGYKFRKCISLYCFLYWYILLLDKSYWNNHSYLFGIVALLLLGSSANHYMSIDAFFDEQIHNKPVPFWNYFLLKFQFFLLYFMAGLKKLDSEWLDGYGLTNLGSHWVFSPFRILLSIEQIDYLIVHWFGFLLDLTIGFWLIFDFTRPYAMIFSTAFHFMNSRLFTIGMFPYVCIVTTPIFCEADWPYKLNNWFVIKEITKPKGKNIDDKKTDNHKVSPKQKLATFLILTHCVLQCLLPYSHIVTKGYNNWTNGLYGYSWDMMVHSWNTALVNVKITDNDKGTEYFIDPTAWTYNDRWSKHADMTIQYAHCLKNNLESLKEQNLVPKSISNISVYVDVWCSLNGRFQQRLFDPNYDLLRAKWSPFRSVEWLLPLLTENDKLRNLLREIQEEVHSWSNYSDVLFVADFPGMYLENYISPDLSNVTMKILNGTVFYSEEDSETRQSIGMKLITNSVRKIKPGDFHRVHTVGFSPSLYMYTFFNQTKSNQ